MQCLNADDNWELASQHFRRLKSLKCLEDFLPDTFEVFAAFAVIAEKLYDLELCREVYDRGDLLYKNDQIEAAGRWFPCLRVA
jgi:hypothetical protein